MVFLHPPEKYAQVKLRISSPRFQVNIFIYLSCHHPVDALNIDPPTKCFGVISTMTTWWLNQPISKICSSNWIISQGKGEIKNVWNRHLDDYIYEKPARLVKLEMMLHPHTAGNNVEKMFETSHKPFIDVGTTFNFKISSRYSTSKWLIDSCISQLMFITSDQKQKHVPESYPNWVPPKSSVVLVLVYIVKQTLFPKMHFLVFRGGACFHAIFQ